MPSEKFLNHSQQAQVVFCFTSLIHSLFPFIRIRFYILCKLKNLVAQLADVLWNFGKSFAVIIKICCLIASFFFLLLLTFWWSVTALPFCAFNRASLMLISSLLVIRISEFFKTIGLKFHSFWIQQWKTNTLFSGAVTLTLFNFSFSLNILLGI